MIIRHRGVHRKLGFLRRFIQRQRDAWEIETNRLALEDEYHIRQVAEGRLRRAVGR